MARLDEAIEDILDAVVAAVTAAIDTNDSGLEDVAAVVRGDRARPMPKMPAIWIVPEPAQFTQATFGDEEAWMLDISIAALVKAETPEDGGRLAQRLAALARRAALTIRHDDALPLVDVTSRSFDPSARSSERNRNLFWTDATIRVTFTVNE